MSENTHLNTAKYWIEKFAKIPVLFAITGFQTRLYDAFAQVPKEIDEDGIIVFGHSAEEAGQVLVTYLARAYEQTCKRAAAL